jgi:hypothetical protein
LLLMITINLAKSSQQSPCYSPNAPSSPDLSRSLPQTNSKSLRTTFSGSCSNDLTSLV